MIAVESRNRHADEVHKVVPREGEGQGKSARENDDLENIEIEKNQPELHQHCRADKEHSEDRPGIRVEELHHFRRHEGGAARALHHEEVEDHRDRETAVNTADPSVHLLVVEGEDHAENVLNNGACDKGYDNRNQNR